MIKAVRLNAYPTRERAQEEANALLLAFAGHELSRRSGFEVTVGFYQREYHVNVCADIDTSSDGFLSTIIARVLASHCRAPTIDVRLPAPAATPRIGQSISQRALAGRPARFPRLTRG